MNQDMKEIKERTKEEGVPETGEREEAAWGTHERELTEREKLDERELEARMAEEENKKVHVVFRMLERFGDLFWLNIVFTLCCIPIITIGASFTALYSTTLKMARKEDGVPTRDFLDAFKKNFKQATAAWLIILVFIGIIYYQVVLIYTGTGTAINILTIVVGLEAVVLTFTLPLLFPLIARFENSTGKMLLNSFILSITHLNVWAVAFFPWIIPLVLAYFQPILFAYTWYFWILILAALTAYAVSIAATKMFTELEMKDAEQREAEAAEKKKRHQDAAKIKNEDGHTYIYKK